MEGNIKEDKGLIESGGSTPERSSYPKTLLLLPTSSLFKDIRMDVESCHMNSRAE